MMLRKITAIGLILCVALGGVAALAQEDAGTGMLESALDYMKEADSLTIDAQFAVRQNGEDRVTGDMLYEAKGGAGYASAVIAHASGEVRDMEMAVSGGTHILRVGDDFYSMPVEAADDEETGGAHEAPRETQGNANPYLGAVMEQLFGTVQEKMEISETGLSLHLAGDEVPAILNLAVSMLGGVADRNARADEDAFAAATASTPVILHGTRGEMEEEADETKAVPTLGSDLHIDRIDLDVAIEGETIAGVQCSIILIGTDADGAALETELAAVIRVTDVNATEPATIDVSGVDMRPMKRQRTGW